jgi:DNA-binding transcriptional LysR family regulator
MNPIDHFDFRTWDLNLLVALDALLQERSVTRAAGRIGLAQSTVSHALSRLRALLGDAVLVRGAAGMEPTPLGLELAGPVREALVQMRDTILRRRAFDPVSQREGQPLTLDTYARALHVAVSPSEERTGPLDQVLATLGVERRIAVSTPRYGSVPPILKETPLLATLPERIARLASRIWGLTVAAPPLDVPAFEVSLLWHVRDERDPAHAWLRYEISAIAETVS